MGCITMKITTGLLWPTHYGSEGKVKKYFNPSFVPSTWWTYAREACMCTWIIVNPERAYAYFLRIVAVNIYVTCIKLCIYSFGF